MTSNIKHAQAIKREISRIELTEADLQLQSLLREQVLTLPSEVRLRWFYLRALPHHELNRVSEDVMGLLRPNNDVTIVSIIGASGIGKTTLLRSLRSKICARYSADIDAGKMPVLYIELPANGEKTLSWKVTFQQILRAGGEFTIGSLNNPQVIDGRLVMSAGRVLVGELREFIEKMVEHRGVRVIVLDEIMHLLRHEKNDMVMDTLKSLSDINGLKLLVVGTYQIGPLMVQYGQVARRSEIVHFRPYALPTGPKDIAELVPAPTAPKDGETPSDAFAFYQALRQSLEMWPCAEVPNLLPAWWQYMDSSLGSIGLMKMSLLRLAALQMDTAKERLTAAAIAKAGKSLKHTSKLKQEQEVGALEILGSCHGESTFGIKYAGLIKQQVLPSKVSNSANDPVAHAQERASA